ncbi:MAG: amino acid adenylation domain-containing protein [Phaeodactylibacter sp.]|uniref:amino acid adenylation domain-containing protein n=1 Tax=Phaeodactylibacter sp. TaxID=1940289 RepID=UPI0032EBE8AA
MQKLHDAILEQSALRPQSVALHCPAEQVSLTYHQLCTEAETLSQALKSLELPAGSLIALYLAKSSTAIVAVLGTLMADLAYLPLDVDAPDQRNQYILEQSRARAVLATAERNFPWMQDAPAQVDIAGEITVYPVSSGAPLAELPHDLAYVLYTSGSTGTPKGVMITHTAARAFVDWAGHTFSLTANDTLTSIAPLHFDLSVFDVFAGLSAGAALVILTPQESKNPLLLSSYMERYGVTTLYATPTLLQLMPRFGKADRYDHRALRQVLFAGEVFPIPALQLLQRVWATARFYNLYGPTETNVCTWYALPQQVEDNRLTPYPIGKACPYDQCAILKGNGEVEAPASGNGELLVAGASLMSGYLGKPDQTEAAFIRHNEQVWYRTGDLVEVDENGNLLYRGRRGRMVKRRGYRIELGEIEAAMHQHPAIEQAACLAREEEQTVKSVVVFYVAPGGKLSHAQLIDFLAERLPAYMLPDQFILLPQIPQTSSQKTDYQALKHQS